MRTDPPRLNEVVFEIVEANLAAGRIAAGTRIRESDLARLFGVSRVPARAALRRLEERGLLAPAEGRGYLVPGGPESPEERRFDAALEISARHRDDLEQRNWRQRVFEEAELEVAAAAVFGSFRTGEAAVAAHYGFSRNVAHELLGRLERIGVAVQRSNGRWQVERLGEKEIRDHYAVRGALEPLALRDGAAAIDRATLAPLIGKLEQALEEPSKVTRRAIRRVRARSPCRHGAADTEPADSGRHPA